MDAVAHDDAPQNLVGIAASRPDLEGDAPVGRGEIRRFSYPAKRAMDLVFSLLILIFFLPLLVVTWIAVRLDSPGPGLFWSHRVGRYGRPFAMPKFRTMTVSAPLSPREDLGAAVDQYMRPLGRALRISSIDEWPQLWNIIRGDMSFIGPRPLLPNDKASLERRSFPNSLKVRPGVSGVSQVRGRNYVTPRRKARYDSFYANNLSLLLDLRILIDTIVVVVTRKGVM